MFENIHIENELISNHIHGGLVIKGNSFTLTSYLVYFKIKV